MSAPIGETVPIQCKARSVLAGIVVSQTIQCSNHRRLGLAAVDSDCHRHLIWQSDALPLSGDVAAPIVMR
jgi:hypothetical protein